MIQKAEISEVNISENKIDPFLLTRKIAFFVIILTILFIMVTRKSAEGIVIPPNKPSSL